MYEFHPHDTGHTRPNTNFSWQGASGGHSLTTERETSTSERVRRQTANYLQIGGIQGYVDPKAPYRGQDFADEWRAYIKDRHAVVEQKSRKFVKEWASTLRSWNSAPGTQNAKGIQSNKDIVEMFENMEKAVNSLPPWNINWDLKDSKGSPIM